MILVTTIQPGSRSNVTVGEISPYSASNCTRNSSACADPGLEVLDSFLNVVQMLFPPNIVEAGEIQMEQQKQ